MGPVASVRSIFCGNLLLRAGAVAMTGVERGVAGESVG
jgi:hypothetical protein